MARSVPEKLPPIIATPVIGAIISGEAAERV